MVWPNASMYVAAVFDEKNFNLDLAIPRNGVRERRRVVQLPHSRVENHIGDLQ
jgi:hypothetical protein